MTPSSGSTTTVTPGARGRPRSGSSGLPIAKHRLPSSTQSANHARTRPTTSVASGATDSDVRSTGSAYGDEHEHIMNEQMQLVSADDINAEDNLEDLVAYADLEAACVHELVCSFADDRLPISDELLPERHRRERMKENARVSADPVTSTLVFGLERMKSASALDVITTPRQIAADHRDPTSHRRHRSKDEGPGLAAPDCVPYDIFPATADSSVEMSRSSSSQSSGGATPKTPTTPSLALTSPRSVNHLSKSMPSEVPSEAPRRSVTSPDLNPRVARQTSSTSRPRAQAPTSRSRANTGTRRPRTPASPGGKPFQSRGVNRPRSASGGSTELTAIPPWQASATPLLYRSSDHSATTASQSPGSWDDVIVPSVSRRLLQEQLEVGDALIAEYDKHGNPIRLVQPPAPVQQRSVSAPLVSPPTVEKASRDPPRPDHIMDEKRALPANSRAEVWEREAPTKVEPIPEARHEDAGCCSLCSIM